MNFKMGPLANITETEIEQGAVYFAKDDNKQYGELYYDDSEGVRVKIAPRISQASFSNNSVLTLLKEDLTEITVDVPAASTDSDGFVTTGEIQHFAGIKTFPSINIRKFDSAVETAWTLTAGKTYDSSNNFIENVSVIASNYTQYLITNPNLIGNDSILANCKSFFADLDTFIDQDTTSSNGLVLNGDRGILFFDSPNSQSPGVAIRNGTIFCTNLGNEKNPITTATITTIYGSLVGNADTATTLKDAIAINGTDFDGSSEIVTDKWGHTRTFQIDSEANDSETNIDGSEESYTLYIPTELTGFNKINSTHLYGTNLGSTMEGEQWTNLYVKNPYIHSTYNYYHLLTSKAETENYTLILPNANGKLIYHTENTQIGSESNPIYIDSSGQALACSKISVLNGGTGLDQIPLGHLMLGAGNNTTSIKTLAPGSKGQILVSNGSDVMPSYITPTFSWNGITISLNINDNAITTQLPEASATAAGVITTNAQSFEGVKTFNSINVNNTLAVAGGATFSDNISIASNIILGGSITTSGTNSQIKMSESQVEIDTPSLYLNGDIIKLGPDNYGDELPKTGLTEGRIFFLLTPEN